MRCKACGEKISEQSDFCPKCGVANPARPDELEQLYQELSALEEEERRQQALYEMCYAEIDEFPWWIFRPWRNLVLDRKVKKHTVLANEALYKKKQKKREILEFERKLHEQS